MRYVLTPIKNGENQQHKKQRVLARMQRKKGPNVRPHELLVGMQTGAAIVENSTEFPQKVKIELPDNPGIALLGIYAKNTKTVIQSNTCIPMFIAALFTKAKIWKAVQVFIDT